MLHQPLNEKYFLLGGAVYSDDGLVEVQFLHFELPLNHYYVLGLNSFGNAVDLDRVALWVEVGADKLLGDLVDLLPAQEGAGADEALFLPLLGNQADCFFLALDIDLFVVFVQYIDRQFEHVSPEVGLDNYFADGLAVDVVFGLLGEGGEEGDPEVVDFGVLVVFEIVLKGEGAAPKLVLFAQLFAGEVGGVPLEGEVVVYFDFEEESLEGLDGDGGLVLFLVLIGWGLLEGEGVAGVEAAFAVEAGQVFFLLEH